MFTTFQQKANAEKEAAKLRSYGIAVSMSKRGSEWVLEYEAPDDDDDDNDDNDNEPEQPEQQTTSTDGGTMFTQQQIVSDTITDLIQESLVGSAAAEPTLGEELGLEATTIRVDGFNFDLIPDSLKRLFTFHSSMEVPAHPFDARSISVAVFAARLSEEGQILPASPSIKNSPYGLVSKYGPQGGELGNNFAILKPDLYVEADFYTDGEVLASVPTVYKAPYNGKEDQSVNVSVLLSTANKAVNNCFDYHNAARETFRQQLVFLANEAGVPVGEQFLVCLVGFPATSKPAHSKEDKDSLFWGVGFNGAYTVGVRKVQVAKQAMPAQLASLRVGADMMIGGKSLKQRMAEEMMKARRAPAPASTPSSSRVPVAPVATVASTTVAVPQSFKSASTTSTPEPAPAVKEEPTPAKSSVLDKLRAIQSTMTTVEDDDFQLMEEEIEPAVIEDEPEETIEPVAEEEAAEEIVFTSKKVNPFSKTSLNHSDSSSNLDENPFA